MHLAQQSAVSGAARHSCILFTPSGHLTHQDCICGSDDLASLSAAVIGNGPAAMMQLHPVQLRQGDHCEGSTL